MTDPSPTQRDLEEVIRNANAKLEGLDPVPFSRPGFRLLHHKVSDFIVELVVESNRRTKRRGGETIEFNDVEIASQNLVSNRSGKIARYLGTVGGVFLGAALSNVFSMITTNQQTLQGLIISVTFSILGSALMVWHFAKE